MNPVMNLPVNHKKKKIDTEEKIPIQSQILNNETKITLNLMNMEIKEEKTEILSATIHPSIQISPNTKSPVKQKTQHSNKTKNIKKHNHKKQNNRGNNKNRSRNKHRNNNNHHTKQQQYQKKKQKQNKANMNQKKKCTNANTLAYVHQQRNIYRQKMLKIGDTSNHSTSMNTNKNMNKQKTNLKKKIKKQQPRNKMSIEEKQKARKDLSNVLVDINAKRCYFHGCKKRLYLVKQQCSYCARVFCYKHGNPLFHSPECAEREKYVMTKERLQRIKDFKRCEMNFKARIVPLNEVQRNTVAKKMRSKIEEQENNRLKKCMRKKKKAKEIDRKANSNHKSLNPKKKIPKRRR